MALADKQRDGFDKRISRIKKGGKNTMGQIEIGPRDEERAKKGKIDNTVRVKKRRKKKVDLASGATSTLVFLAIFFGGLSMFVGQAASFHFFEEGGLVPIDLGIAAIEPYLQYAPLLIGGLLALAFGYTFRLMSGLKFLALAGGFGAVFHYKLDLMQSMPGLYAGFFSEEYVKAVLAAV